MPESSLFRDAIVFFEKLGIYDVVLPFLLVFTIVFAILEKTKVLGTEEIEGAKYSKKNLNAIVAFTIAFITIASSRLVEIIADVSGQMVILLILSVFFLLLVGSFWKEEEGVFLKAGWKQLFMWIMFIGIVLIFLQAIKTDNGDSWLEAGWEYIFSGNNAAVVGSIIMVIVLIVLLYFTVREPQRKTNDSHKHES